MEEINTMYLTKKDQPEGILFYKKDSPGLQIDIHIQYLNFVLNKHNFYITITNNNGEILVPRTEPITIDFAKIDTTEKLDKKLGVGEIALFAELTEEELKNSNFIKVSINIDNNLERTLVLYIVGGDNEHRS